MEPVSSSSSEDEDIVKPEFKEEEEKTHETNVGKILQNQTTKKGIMVMFAIIFSIPIFDYSTYWSIPSARETSLN
jgi:hypothetical protein